jgi:hypothetical protein
MNVLMNEFAVVVMGNERLVARLVIEYVWRIDEWVGSKSDQVLNLIQLSTRNPSVTRSKYDDWIHVRRIWTLQGTKTLLSDSRRRMLKQMIINSNNQSKVQECMKELRLADEPPKSVILDTAEFYNGPRHEWDGYNEYGTFDGFSDFRNLINHHSKLCQDIELCVNTARVMDHGFINNIMRASALPHRSSAETSFDWVRTYWSFFDYGKRKVLSKISKTNSNQILISFSTRYILAENENV